MLLSPWSALDPLTEQAPGCGPGLLNCRQGSADREDLALDPAQGQLRTLDHLVHILPHLEAR
jgi:hypothetical protein